MFKTSCVVEGVENTFCPSGCIPVASYDKILADYGNKLQEALDAQNLREAELQKCGAKLQKYIKGGPPCPSCPPSPSCPSCPPPPSQTPSKQAFCDPNADPPQLCPDQSKCPQCGGVSCPCPSPE